MNKISEIKSQIEKFLSIENKFITNTQLELFIENKSITDNQLEIFIKNKFYYIFINSDYSIDFTDSEYIPIIQFDNIKNFKIHFIKELKKYQL